MLLIKVEHNQFTKLCCSVTSVLFVLVVYMEVFPKPNTVSDHIKAFLDETQWPEHIKDPYLKQIKRRTSSNMQLYLDFFLVNYSCSLKCIEKNLVNYSYFGSCPRFEVFLIMNLYGIIFKSGKSIFTTKGLMFM